MDDLFHTDNAKVIIRREDRANYILYGVCDYYGINLSQLKSRRKGDRLNRKRIALKLLREVADCPWKDVCELLGYSPRGMYWLFAQLNRLNQDLDPSFYGNKELKTTYKNILKHLKLEQ